MKCNVSFTYYQLLSALYNCDGGEGTLRNRIKDLRKNSKMTQEELAIQVGVSRQSIIAIESGKYNPSLELAYNISKVFDCIIEEVFILEEGGDS
jgi:putative transcriptional regulator